MGKNLDTYVDNSAELRFIFNKLYINGSITKEEYSNILEILSKGSC